MSRTLAEILHQQKIEALERQAETIRAYPAGAERSREARTLINAVMFDHALGRLSRAERAQILGLLDFARDLCAPEGADSEDEPGPMD